MKPAVGAGLISSGAFKSQAQQPSESRHKTANVSITFSRDFHLYRNCKQVLECIVPSAQLGADGLGGERR